jgi:hypothetical protein
MSNTPIRAVRVADEVWQPAKAKAENLGIPLTAVIVTALIEFLEGEL